MEPQKRVPQGSLLLKRLLVEEISHRKVVPSELLTFKGSSWNKR